MTAGLFGVLICFSQSVGATARQRSSKEQKDQNRSMMIVCTKTKMNESQNNNDVAVWNDRSQTTCLIRSYYFILLMIEIRRRLLFDSPLQILLNKEVMFYAHC